MVLSPRILAFAVAVASLPCRVFGTTPERCQLDDSIGNEDGLACAEGVLETIDIASLSSNATTQETRLTAGWYDPKICDGEYCVFANREAAHGRGLSVITTVQNLQKIRRYQDRLDDPGINRNNRHPPPFNAQEVDSQGLVLVANQTLRRGETLMAWSPVIMVRKTFFDDVSPSKQDSLLAAAFQLLPDPTKKAFHEQTRAADAARTRVLKDVILRHGFETDVGWAAHGRPNELHYAIYPEAAIFKHHCRPNVVWYVDGFHIFHTNVVRRVQPGEELTISRIIDPVLTRLERQRILRKSRGTECSCSLCSGNKDSATGTTESDKRIKEIKRIKAKLSDHESKGVTTEKIERFVSLYKEEHLEIGLGDAYELAALNYNYLGHSKEAGKYATLSAQAASIEGGVNSNNAIAMRIMAKDPVGHYSYRMKLKK